MLLSAMPGVPNPQAVALWELGRRRDTHVCKTISSPPAIATTGQQSQKGSMPPLILFPTYLIISITPNLLKPHKGFT